MLHAVWDVVAGVRVRGHVNDRAYRERAEGARCHPERAPDPERAERVEGSPHGREGSAPPHVVLVHGLGMAANSLEPPMRALGDRLAASALDLPGFGKSKAHGRHLSLAELADALTEWLRVRGIRAPILVGQSHGCQVVVEAVAREPLALVPHVVRDYARAGPARLIATLRDAVRDRIEDKLACVDVPVTIVNGARDPVSPPAWGERLARLTGMHVGGAGARYVVVADAAHAVPFSRPAALAAEVVGIARRLAGS